MHLRHGEGETGGHLSVVPSPELPSAPGWLQGVDVDSERRGAAKHALVVTGEPHRLALAPQEVHRGEGRTFLVIRRFSP